jgi:hypothetical protein
VRDEYKILKTVLASANWRGQSKGSPPQVSVDSLRGQAVIIVSIIVCRSRPCRTADPRSVGRPLRHCTNDFRQDKAGAVSPRNPLQECISRVGKASSA